MTKTLTVLIARSADACYARFCSVARATEWVPHVNRAEVLRLDPEGRAAEVQFTATSDNGAVMQYTLLYSYDAARRRVAWAPGEGVLIGVRGYASFEERGGSCEMHYALEPGLGRGGNLYKIVAEARAVLESFRAWVEGTS